ncbi:MAG TPA: bifunctional metallophosphatase/5'-nucleotidase [Micromonosporaceae bacterium]|jgi:5'-nucleotidase|nr:bifunctional metallophosphatase/5'-nucleotidase [Micromonosporaceae bacterium]
MSKPRRRGLTILRYVAVPALAIGVLAAVPLGGSTTHPPQAARWTPMTPVSVTYDDSVPAAFLAHGHLLGFNDFHGNIDPPVGSAGLVNGNPAGGVEYLATAIKRLRAAGQADGSAVLTVSAGDNIGASPLVSAAFHDEPAIEELNLLGTDISSVGNHEFDEGTDELRRMQNGGCHPVDGCQDGDPFAGAAFPYLAANVVDKTTGQPMLAPVSIKMVNGVPVGFVGMTLRGTPTIVNPAGITTVDFKDEIETANKWAKVLKFAGVKAMVLLIHEGGMQNPPPTVADISSCANFAGPITDIVAGLRPEFGIVISGHTHRFYSCALPNSSGELSVVTSAGSFGTLVTDVSFTVNRNNRKFASIEAHNVLVENGIRNPDGSWQKDASGNFIRNPALVDPGAKAIADKYRIAVAPLANRIVGSISADIVRDTKPNQESPLGDVIADAQLRYTTGVGAQIALMNPGGIRASLSFAFSPGGEAPGLVTYGECFTVQPFNNLIVTQTFTGAQLKDVLEQQFVGFGGQTLQRILQVSAGLTYSYDSSAAASPGNRVTNLAFNGVPIDPAASYRVTTNDFLANGGDGFTNLKAGAGRVTAPGFDVDALTAYLATGPIAPGTADRITKLA